MEDLRSELRNAFDSEQAISPPSADLRRSIVHTVTTRPRRETNAQWLAVVAALLIGTLVVVGLMSSRRTAPAQPRPSPVNDYGPPPAGVPLFYMQDTTHAGWYIGFDWTGAPRGAIKLAQPLRPDDSLTQSPDGSGFQASMGGKGGAGGYLDRLGQPVVAPGSGPPRGSWADDSRHVCRISLNQKTMMLTLETQLVGEAPREIAPIIRWQGDQSAIDVAACSFNNDRAIVSRSTVSWTNEVWVIRISDGQTLSHHAYRDGQLAPIVASSDGAYIAENTFDTVRLGVAAYPGVTVIRRVSDWTQVASEGGSTVRGFSGDDSLILLTPKLLPEVRGISVVEVGTGRIMWRYDGSDQGLSAYFTEPSGAAFAVMLKRPFDQSLHPQVSVVMVLVGRILVIPGQYFRP